MSLAMEKGCYMKKILLLDDDTSILAEVANLLRNFEFELYACESVACAEQVIAENGMPDFAIVDLFLLGGRGDTLSNDFVKHRLEVSGVPYGRFTSSPSLVPEHCAGEWIVDKRDFYRSPDVLLERLLASLP
jgi:DNA-binding NtrC family response regulator